MGWEILLYVLLGGGVIFALPSTMYFFMFLGIFHRRKNPAFEETDLQGTPYQLYEERLKADIVYVKQLSYQPIHLRAEDGVKLFGRYYRADSDKLIILCHGFQSNAFNNFSVILKDLLAENYNVLLIDQRAHENSGGHFTTIGCKEQSDLRLWIQYAAEKEEIQRILVYGISMGAATVGLASDKITTPKVKGLIMEAGFPCFYEELQWCIGKGRFKKAALNCMSLMAKLFLKSDIKHSAEETLANNKIPVLFLHGEADIEVPMEFTERNYTACAAPKQLIKVKDAGHTLCYIAGGETVQTAVFDFMNECMKK